MNCICKLVTLCFVVFSASSFSYEHVNINQDGVIGDFYYTKGVSNQPAVIFFGGSDGGNFISKSSQFVDKIHTYTNAGYAVFSLSYFDYSKVDKLPTSLTEIPLEYFEKAINWVLTQKGIAKSGVAVYGHSRGGELSLILASYFPQIKTVIASAPSAYIWGSYDAYMTEEEWKAGIAKKTCGTAAWTYKGKDVSGICQDNYLIYNPWYKVIDTPAKVSPFAIKVEEMKANVLLLSGEYDTVWPAKDMSNRVMSRLKKHNYPFVYEHNTYDAGHDLVLLAWDDSLTFIKKYFPAK